MKKVSLMLCSVFLITQFFSSCKTSSLRTESITIQSRQIPPEMATETFTLIGILKERKSYDKYLKHGFSSYLGNYVLATKEELESTYKDIDKYRFVMDYNDSFSNNAHIGTVKHYNYYIHDRKKGKKYYRRTGSSGFAAEIKTYLKAIANAQKEHANSNYTKRQ